MIFSSVLSRFLIYDNVRSQMKQINFFRKRIGNILKTSEINRDEQLYFTKVINEFCKNIYVPKIDKAKLVKVFYDIRELPEKIYKDDKVIDMHLVFSDEYFRLSKKIDEKYREIRKKIFNRTADVESIVIFPRTGFIRFLHNNMSIGTYDMPLHLKAVEFIYLPVIFVNSWNHMLATRWTFHITKRLGGYNKVSVSVTEGTREDAEKFAREISKVEEKAKKSKSERKGKYERERIGI